SSWSGSNRVTVSIINSTRLGHLRYSEALLARARSATVSMLSLVYPFSASSATTAQKIASSRALPRRRGRRRWSISLEGTDCMPGILRTVGHGRGPDGDSDTGRLHPRGPHRQLTELRTRPTRVFSTTASRAPSQQHGPHDQTPQRRRRRHRTHHVEPHPAGFEPAAHPRRLDLGQPLHRARRSQRVVERNTAAHRDRQRHHRAHQRRRQPPHNRPRRPDAHPHRHRRQHRIGHEHHQEPGVEDRLVDALHHPHHHPVAHPRQPRHHPHREPEERARQQSRHHRGRHHRGQPHTLHDPSPLFHRTTHRTARPADRAGAAYPQPNTAPRQEPYATGSPRCVTVYNPAVDALLGLLRTPRAHDAFLLRVVLDPPWSLDVRDRAPLTLLVVARGEAWLRPAHGPPRRLEAGDVAVVRGPDPYTVAHSPTRHPRAVIGADQRCTTLHGAPLTETMG